MEKKTSAKNKETEIDFNVLKEQLIAELREELKAELKEEIRTKKGKEENEKLSASRAAMKKSEKYLKEPVAIEFFKGGIEFQDDVFVSVNEYNALIQRGKRVKVPRYVAEQIEANRKQEMRTTILTEKYQRDYEAAKETFNM